MNCSQSQDLLQRRLDGEAIDRALLDQHLNSCADCRQLHAAAGRLEDGLRLLTAPVPPFSLAASIVGRVNADRRARMRSRRRWYVGAAVAAGLLVAVFAGWQGKFFRGNDASFVQTTQPALPTPPQLQQDKESAEPPSLEAVYDVGSALASLGGKMANETVGQGKVLLPDKVTAPGVTTSPTVQPVVDPSAQSLKQASQGISAGFSPMTTSFRRAFNLALSEAPTVPEEQ